MRILAAGNWESEYIKDSWQRPLEKIYSAVCVNVIPFIAQCDYKNLPVQRYLQSLIRRDNFDFFYFYADGLHPTFPDQFFQTVRGAGIPVVTFYADDEPEKWYLFNKRFDHRYDIVASHSRRGWERRRDDGFGERSLYVPWGFNPDAFYKIKNVEKTYDVVFIGKHKEAGITEITDEDGKIRQDILVKVYNICRENGYTFNVFGLGWDNHPILKDVYGGMLSHGKMIEVYNRSRIVFNPGFSCDEDYSGFQTKLRHYEVPGCGAFQLVNRNPDLIEQFTPDKETVYFDNDDELRDKILYYLKNNGARESVALKGYERAQREHTTVQRLDTLFQGARRVFPSRPCTVTGPLPRRIARVYIGEEPPSANDITPKKNVQVFLAASIEHALRMVEKDLAGFHFIHLIPGDFFNISLEAGYEIIRPLLDAAGPGQVISVRSVIQFFLPHSNFVQVNGYTFSGFILSPDLEQTPFERSMELAAQPFLPPLQFPGRSRYLFNYLIPPAVLLSLKDKITGSAPEPAKETGLFTDSHVTHSSRIVNQFLIKKQPPEPRTFRKWRYRQIISQLTAQNKSFVIYGARGNPIPLLIEEVNNCRAPMTGFIDRSMAGQTVQGFPVYSREELDKLKPGAILISAENSGPEIYRDLSDRFCRSAVIPLYDYSDNIIDAGL